jgi:hypothetical protein
MITSTLPAVRRATTPAQRVILLLGVPATLALLAWTGYGIVASVSRASYTVSYSVPVSGSQLTMNIDGGDAAIQGGAASGSARLTGTVSYDMVRPSIRPTLSDTHGARGTSIDFTCPWSNCGVEGVAGVPAATVTSVSTGGGSVTASGLTAPVTASTGGGDVTASGLTAGASLSTGGGSVTATDVSGGMTVLSGGGDVSGDQIAGKMLDLTTEGGNVQVTSLGVPDVTISSGGGDVDLTFTTVPKDLQVNSAGGNVTIVLPLASTGYDLQLSGGCGGVSHPVPSSANSAPEQAWCGNVSSTVPDDSSAKNVIGVSSQGGVITIS